MSEKDDTFMKCKTRLEPLMMNEKFMDDEACLSLQIDALESKVAEQEAELEFQRDLVRRFSAEIDRQAAENQRLKETHEDDKKIICQLIKDLDVANAKITVLRDKIERS